ncbi:MAG: peptidylprolyl isomerase [Solirubrobacteraceae bacterium]|nr:peptidylprolyl isomerase [Solirubrobacteraceae bacterium]
MRTPLTILLAAAALGLAACGSDDKSASEGSTPTTADGAVDTSAALANAVKESSCKKVEKPKPKSVDTPKPKGKLDPSKDYYVNLDTNCGSISIKLDVKDNPKTANVLATLAKAGYYDNTAFHRVVKGWVVQGGDPKGDGTGGPDWRVVEAPSKNAKYSRGVVAMAKTATDPDGASGSQFFIVVGIDAGLPPQYAIAGKVKTGRKAVDAISNLGADGADGPPATPVVITKATLEVK